MCSKGRFLAAGVLALGLAGLGGCGDDGSPEPVTGVLGGNSAVGTVSATNPAVYTAPDLVPGQATVVVKAVSRENSSEADSCSVTVQFTTQAAGCSMGPPTKCSLSSIPGATLRLWMVRTSATPARGQ